MARHLMKGFRNVVLAGLPASGKSTIGKTYAHHTGRNFLDFDAYVEHLSGRSVKELFAREGEEGFRAHERRALQKILTRNHTVIALGGGTLCSEENFTLLRQIGLLVFVETPLSTLAARVFSADTRRPMFASCTDETSVQSTLEGLWELRRDYYEACDLRLGTALASVDNLRVHLAMLERRLLGHERRARDARANDEAREAGELGAVGEVRSNREILEAEGDVFAVPEILIDESSRPLLMQLRALGIPDSALRPVAEGSLETDGASKREDASTTGVVELVAGESASRGGQGGSGFGSTGAGAASARSRDGGRAGASGQVRGGLRLESRAGTSDNLVGRPSLAKEMEARMPSGGRPRRTSSPRGREREEGTRTGRGEREGPEGRESREPRDPNAQREPRPPRDPNVPREPRPPRDPNAPREFRGARDGRPPRDPNAPRENRPPRDPNAPQRHFDGPREPRPPRDPNAPRENRPPREPREPRDPNAPQRNFDGPREPRSPREPRDLNAPREPREPNAPQRHFDGLREPRPPRDLNAPRENRPPREPRDLNAPREPRDPNAPQRNFDGPREPRPPRDPNAPRENRPPREPRDLNAPREPRDPNAPQRHFDGPREPRPPRAPNAPRENRPPREPRDLNGPRDSGAPRADREKRVVIEGKPARPEGGE